MTKVARNGFKKLLANVKMNSLSLDENGEFTQINSSTNKKRMAGDSSRKWWGGGSSDNPNKLWKPKRCLITEQDLREIWADQDDLCYWFKVPLDFNLLFSNYQDYFSKHPMAPSVDRKDDSLDYTKENVVICCRLANFGRNIYPFDKFHDVIDLVTHKTKPHTLAQYFND